MHLIITDSHLHYDLQKELLSTQNNATLANFEVVNPITFLNRFSKTNYISEIEALFQLNLRLKKEQSPIFKDLLYKTSFHKELYTILSDLKRNGCKVNALKEDNDTRKELKRILSLLEDLSLEADLYHDAYEAIIQNDNYSHIHFINYYPSSYYEELIYKHMCEHGARSEYKTIIPQNIAYSYATNIRQEVENVAIKICEINSDSLEDIQLLIPDNTYLPFISFVFNRYNIPYYASDEKESCNIQNALLSLVAFLKSNKINDLLAFIYSPLINIKFKNELTNYLDIFKLDYQGLCSPFDYTSRIDFTKNVFDRLHEKDVLDLEEKASFAQSELLPLLQALQFDNPYVLLKSFYNLFMHNEYLSVNDKQYLSLLKNKIIPLKDIFERAEQKEALQYLSDTLDSLAISTPRISNVVRVTSYTNSYLNTKHTFILGASQKNYPNFSSLSGLFDESIVEDLPNYPSLDTRYQKHLRKLQNCISVAENLYVSYPASNFEGKPIESSLELELFLKIEKAPHLDIRDNDYYSYPNHHISEENAAKILYPNNTVVGSISSIERFFGCPYAYFLYSGLHLKTLNKINIGENTLGSLHHEFLERMINKHGKYYAECSDEEIWEFLDEEFKAYLNVFPKDGDKVQLIKAITFINIRKSIDGLKELEEHTRFIPKEVEHNFYVDFLTHNDITLKLRGKIDRYDTNENGFRVIDYKSSNKEFKPATFHAGIQLQLPTYAAILDVELNGKEPYGFYYYSLANSTTTDMPYKINRPRGKSAVITIEELSNDNINNQLSGQTFVKDDLMLASLDDNAKHINGISIKKDGTYSPTKHDYDTLRADLELIYQYFIEELQNSNIKCEPNSEACKYCDYKSICNFKGRVLKVQKLPMFKEEK